jgi:signal transduction histidine kinase
MQMSASMCTPWWRKKIYLRRLVVGVGLIAELLVLVSVLIGMNRPVSADLTLAPGANKPGFCQVISVRPFSDPWVHGIQAGLQVQVVGAGENNGCQITTQSIRLRPAGINSPPISVNVLPLPTDFIDLAMALLLALIFSVTGIAIFLRAQNRSTAHITYALFFCTSVLLCMLNLRGTDYFWINLLGFILVMLMRGLSATFVCLFPYPAFEHGKPRAVPFWPYIPVIIGILLSLVSLAMPFTQPPLGFVFVLITFVYNVACILLVIWVMGWGLRHLSKQERQFVRMVVIGIIFLLLPLVLNLNLVRLDTIVEQSLVRLIPIPLAVLPLACDYALFRTQLLGTTRLLSRQAMRVLLWLLLASAFIFPCMILLRVLAELKVPRENLDYVFAGMLVASLGFFPVVWQKVREVGDQVFYQDFYEYNRSLRDFSAALTRLQGIEQISTFMLPRLAHLLNATETGLLLRASSTIYTLRNSGNSQKTPFQWSIYRHKAAEGVPAHVQDLPEERLIGIANLGLTHLVADSADPLLLDGVLLLPLYDSSRCSGFLYLAPKSNREPYSKQDASFLVTLASQLSVLEINSRYLEQAQASAQQLAALNHRVISAQEDERRYLALELHDEGLQYAMLVLRQLSDASNMAEVAEVMPLARSVVASLRSTCLKLRPPLLDELGLEEAFRWLARQTEELSGRKILIEVACLGCWETRPADDIELALYRVGQEALSNIFKYAGANHVGIRLRRKASGDISLLVSDNGRGLGQRQRVAENLGLAGMHERMAALDGSLQIRTTPGRGVTIRAVYRQPATTVLSPLLVISEEKLPEREEVLS